MARRLLVTAECCRVRNTWSAVERRTQGAMYNITRVESHHRDAEITLRHQPQLTRGHVAESADRVRLRRGCEGSGFIVVPKAAARAREPMVFESTTLALIVGRAGIL